VAVAVAAAAAADASPGLPTRATVESWSAADVVCWLPGYAPQLVAWITSKENEIEIDGKSLLNDFNDAALREVGVSNSRDRGRLLSAIEIINNNGHGNGNGNDASKWSSSQVLSWLKSVHAPAALIKHIESDPANVLNGAALINVTDSSLQQMGVALSVHRFKLLRLIAALMRV